MTIQKAQQIIDDFLKTQPLRKHHARYMFSKDGSHTFQAFRTVTGHVGKPLVYEIDAKGVIWELGLMDSLRALNDEGMMSKA